MTHLGFKIWYDDGSLWWNGPSRQDGPFSEAPDDGVVEVWVYRRENGQLYRQSFNGDDYYFSDDGELFGSNSDDLETNQKRYPGCTFKRGRWVSHDKMAQIQTRTAEDREI